MRELWRWIRDWRNGAVILASVLVAYLGVLVVTSIQDRGRAIQAAISATSSEREARVAAVKRIDQLLKQIAVLERDVRGNSALIAALEQQIRDLGGQPVVITTTSGSSGGSSPSPAPTPSSTTSPAPRPSPSPSRPPRPSPSPTRTCVVVVCV